MLFSPLALSLDSLMVAAALSPIVARRHILPLIVSFGLCDAGASLIGPMSGLQSAASAPAAAATLLLWGVLIALNLPRIGRWCQAPGWAYLLAPLLAIDNLIVNGAAPASAGLASGALAALGFALGGTVLRLAPALMPMQRWAGLPLIVAGLLLAH